MKALEEVAIEGGTSGNVVIFDRATADNIWFYLLERKSTDDNGQKITFEDGDLVMIARTLIEETGKSAMYSRPIKISRNTLVYSAQRDYTVEGQPLLDRQPKEIYIVIPSGVMINKKKHKRTMVNRFPAMELTNKVPEAFVNLMGIYGYTESQAVQMYNHLMGTQFPVPDEKKRRKILQTVGLAAALLALVGATAAGIKRINDVGKSPKYQVVVEEARNTPGTNMYNASRTQ